MRIAFLGDGSLNHVRRWAGYFHERGHEMLLLSFESVDGCLVPARRLEEPIPDEAPRLSLGARLHHGKSSSAFARTS